MSVQVPGPRPTSPVNGRLIGAAAVMLILALTGWFLYVGRDLLVPIVASVLCVFAISGLSTLLTRLRPLRRLPGWTRDLIAAGLICAALVELTFMILGNIGAMAAQAPAYQLALGDLVRQVAGMLDLDREQTLRAIQSELSGVLDLAGLLRAAAASAAAALVVLIFVQIGRAHV